ncbi:MAG: ABC transporter permease subunit [Lachnospiraceae bacterium]|jgi:spermidine/putrescine transport system permease protein|nr:ABC transporter permease subunit [Lachnospiraceae bacterium]MCI8996366.1 ABC transporter permease subunit [Lachnospiraceae bacterium]MCI9133958.1 ABC transporter permease subunit [Lachnospiraceae bacterium]
MNRFFKKHLGVLATVGPTIAWLGIFLFIPLAYVILMTVLTKNSYGGVDFVFTLENYQNLFNNEYLRVFWDSIWLSLQTTVICLLVGYPFAYILANAPKRWKSTLVMLLMLPFWTNSLIRTYGWNTLLRTEGIVNHFLQGIGLIKQPLEMLYTDGAVLLGMVYALLPFTVLPLYTSIEKLDGSLLEAGSDLGASQLHIFTRIILPLTMPGIFAGSIQTFIPSLGFFFISDMMGGAKTMYIGNLIKNQFLSARNWPFGAALSIVLIVITLILMKLYTRVGSLEDMA